MKRLTQKQVKRMGACSPAREWIEAEAAAGKTANDLWLTCPNFAWMTWMLGHLPLDNMRLTYATVGGVVIHNATLPDGRKLIDLAKDYPELSECLKAGIRFAAGEMLYEDFDLIRESARVVLQRVEGSAVFWAVQAFICAGGGQHCAVSHVFEYLETISYPGGDDAINAELARCIRLALPTWDSVLALTGNRRFTELYETLEDDEPLF